MKNTDIRAHHFRIAMLAILLLMGMQSLRAQSIHLSEQLDSCSKLEHIKRSYLKTNTIAWGFLISNIAYERELTRTLSLSVPVYYSALNYFHHDVKFRGFGIIPELRYYPEIDSKWHVFPYFAVHLNFLYYNYATGGEYRYQDHNRTHPLLGFGINWGVRIPFRKDGHDTRWGIEAQMGLGVGFMKTDKFINKINGQRVDIYNESYFGFDNLALSLYYELDNRKKNHYK